MSVVVFVAMVTGGRSDGYRVTFPDLAGLEAEGRDLPELLLNARQALTGRLESFEKDGDAWPTATPLEDIQIDPGAMAIPVDVLVDDPPVRINISLGERLLQRLDAAANARGMTRSGFIAQSVKVTLGETPAGSADLDAVGRRLQDELSALGRRINDSIGPDSPFTRRMNELDDVVYDGVRKAADSVSAAMSRRKGAARAAGRTSEHDPSGT